MNRDVHAPDETAAGGGDALANLGRRDQRDAPLVSAVSRALIGASAGLSAGSRRMLAALLAFFAWRLAKGTRRIVMTNLALAYPQLEPTERTHLGRAVLTHTISGYLELGEAWFGDVQRWQRRIRSIHGLHGIDRERPRGLLILAPHIGSWELLNQFVAQRHGVTALYLPPRIGGLEPLMVEGRRRGGSALVPTTAAGLKSIYRALARGEIVGVLPDQVPGRRGGVHVPFFGVTAFTMTLVHRLLRRSGAAVVVGAALRCPGGRAYEIHFLEPDAAIHDADPRVSATAMNRAIEALVRMAPEQYQWAYQRYKNPPDGEPSPYDED